MFFYEAQHMWRPRWSFFAASRTRSSCASATVLCSPTFRVFSQGLLDSTQASPGSQASAMTRPSSSTQAPAALIGAVLQGPSTTGGPELQGVHRRRVSFGVVNVVEVSHKDEDAELLEVAAICPFPASLPIISPGPH